MSNGLLLINLGTPDSYDVKAVKKYLQEFLSDKHVINIPVLLRYLFLYCIILPFRSKKTSKAYKAIWTDKGSPLLVNNLDLRDKLQLYVNEEKINLKVSLGMRYGNPSIHNGLKELQHCKNITILPLYPQYSTSATLSCIEKVKREIKVLFKNAAQNPNAPKFNLIKDFHQHPLFIESLSKKIQPFLDSHDFILFSYHGIPENHILLDECKTLCKNSCNKKSSGNVNCYRAQSLRTTKAVAKTLALDSDRFLTTFQSRFGRTKWIEPYTDKILIELRKKNIKNLLIVCPSFVADCLETTEEIGIRAKAQWLESGGTKLTLVPSLNHDDYWIKSLYQITQNAQNLF